MVLASYTKVLTYMLFYENDAASLFVFPEQHLAVTQWKGFASSSVLRDILDKLKQIYAQHEIYYALGDNRHLKVIRPADQEYINNEWLPEVLKKNQLRKSATIESEDVFGKISTDNILRAADKYINFDTAFFNNFEAAVNWLGVNINQEDIAA